MSPVEMLLTKLPEVTRSGKGWSSRCPAHDDSRASLSIGEGDDGRALVKCHAGCDVEAICQAVGVRLVDLMPKEDSLHAKGKSKSNGKPRIVAEYNYRDETGALVFQAIRFEPKDFRQRKPDGKGGWNWSVKGTRVVPYRLPELLADPSRTVVIAEGEKDCENLARIGILATCNACGAGKWTAEHSAFLQNRLVIILPDNDEPGRNHANQVARSLQGIAKSIKIIELPSLPPKGDASDWIAAGGTKEELKRLAASVKDWNPAEPKPWPELEAFDDFELPDFPIHILPDVLRQWVNAQSIATQTPADLPGILALAVCSACISRRVVVEPRPGWREPVNLFTAILLEPGNRKSAVFSEAVKPLREYESELIEAARPTIARCQSERRQEESRLRKLEKTAAEKRGDEALQARIEAAELAANLGEQTEPVLPQLLVDDATSEKLGMILAEQNGRIASMSPEGGVFDLMAGLYSKSGMPQFGVYLLGHSGDDLVTDRVCRKSVRVERPALTCAYAMQPAVIKGIAENAAFRGRGLLARFLYAAPVSWIGQREIAPPPVSNAIREAYRQKVRELAETDCDMVLQLTPEADGTLREWEAAIEGMLGEGGAMEVLRDWGAKLAGATLRIAAVLHCVKHGVVGRIEKSTISSAVALASYLIPHSYFVLQMMLATEESADDDARYVLRWIKRHRRSEFTKSEAQHHGKQRFPKADDIDDALKELEKRNYIRLRQAEANGPGRPKSPQYEVNPVIYAEAESKDRIPRYRKQVEESGESDFGNNGSAGKQLDVTKRIQVTI